MVTHFNWSTDQLNLETEPAFPGANPNQIDRTLEYEALLTASLTPEHFYLTYIPVKKTTHALNTRTYWTFYGLNDVNNNPLRPNDHNWVVFDTVTISTGKPLISWTTRLHPTIAQLEKRIQRAERHQLRPLPRLYTNVRDPFRTTYSTKAFSFDDTQGLDPLIC